MATVKTAARRWACACAVCACVWVGDAHGRFSMGNSEPSAPGTKDEPATGAAALLRPRRDAACTHGRYAARARAASIG